MSVELRVEDHNEPHGDAVSPDEDAHNEDSGVIVVGEKVERAGREESKEILVKSIQI